MSTSGGVGGRGPQGPLLPDFLKGFAMPYFRMDEGAYEDMVSELSEDELEMMDMTPPSGEFEYDGAKASFVPGTLEDVARLTLEALKAMGASAFYVKYDGGHDEGFAHADHVVVGDQRVSVAEAAKALSAAGLAERMRREVPRVKEHGDRSPEKLIEGALWELAEALASKLLGDGYGTGEYSMYGAFVADLQTGAIRDEKNVEMPEGMEWD